VLSGRGVGLRDEQMARLGDDPPPHDVFDEVERAVVAYSRRLTRMQPIDDDLYAELVRHFTPAALVELCFIVGSANMVNRFHATFLTDVEAATSTALAVSCPVPLPRHPREG
jgi:alkylhydroperoxidase family enzyme